MEIAKCLRCGKLYQRIKTLVCPPCEVEEEKEIFQVQKYMRDNPGKTLTEISDALNIYLEDIDRWIEEKRLSVEVQHLSDRKDALKKLYESVKEGLDQSPSKHYPNPTGHSDSSSSGGKYRRS